MFIKESYIKQIGPKKFRVYSEKGRNMGTYTSKASAKKRLRQIEYFKSLDSANDAHLLPRGGEGDVPEFFRKNLDYGERDKVLKKKISKLKAAKSALQDLGFKKEAAAIKNNIKSLLLNAFLTLGLFGAGIHLANTSLESGRLKEIMADFALEESPNLQEKKMEFPIGTPTDTIISSMYSDISIENNDKKDIIINFLEEYNPNLTFGSSGLQLKQEHIFKKHMAEVAYPDLRSILEKFSKRLESGYTPSEVGSVGKMSPSPEGMNFTMTAEGFSEKIYNDKVDYSWPRDRNKPDSKGHWMIGYGHQLKEDELASGMITLPSGKVVRWTDGITKEEGRELKQKDLVSISILNAGVNPEEEMTRGMFDALTDLSYNIGPNRLSRLLSESRDELGRISPDLFAKKLSGWTKVIDPKKEKGIKIRRISQLLMSRGILLPEEPSHIESLFKDQETKMATPDKEVVIKYIKHYGNDKISKEQVTRILNSLGENPPNSPEEFVSVLRSKF